jgi:hypothetical protein
MPAVSTVYLWMAKHKEFSESYARAREDQADTLADQILEIADDGRNDTYTDDEGKEFVNHDVINRSRLRVDARKWVAAKLKPKKYGDKVTTEHTGPGGGSIGITTSGTIDHRVLPATAEFIGALLRAGADTPSAQPDADGPVLPAPVRSEADGS